MSEQHSGTTPNLPPVVVNNVALAPLEVAGERVLTLAMVDEVHGRPSGTARRNFNANKERLVEGEDFIVRNSSDSAALGIRAANGITLLTESGYLMLVKSLTDDLAWQVQKALVKSYFTKPAPQPASNVIDMRDASQLRIATIQLLEMNQEKDERIAQLEPKASALDLISASEGSLTFTQGAKILGIKQDTMTKWMNANGWIYRQNGSWVAYRTQIVNGRLEYKEHTYTSQTTGSQSTKQYCHITQKGLAKLAIVFGAEMKEAA